MAIPRYSPHRRVHGRDLNLVMDYIEAGIEALLGPSTELASPVGASLPPAYVKSLTAGPGIALSSSTGNVLMQQVGGVSLAYVAFVDKIGDQGTSGTNPFSSAAKVTFNSAQIDVFSDFDGTGRFTAHTGGNYAVSSHVEVQVYGPAVGSFPTGALYLNKIGTGNIAGGHTGNNVLAPELAGLSLQAIVPLAVGEQLEVWMKVDTTGCIAIGSEDFTWFSVARLP